MNAFDPHRQHMLVGFVLGQIMATLGQIEISILIKP